MGQLYHTGTTSPDGIRKFTDGAQHMALESLLAGEDEYRGVIVVHEGQFEYEEFPASTTDGVCGQGSGGIGDFLHKLKVAGSGSVTLTDGTTAFSTTFAAGEHTFNMLSKNGAWKVTTPASTTCIAIGDFS